MHRPHISKRFTIIHIKLSTLHVQSYFSLILRLKFGRGFLQLGIFKQPLQFSICRRHTISASIWILSVWNLISLSLEFYLAMVVMQNSLTCISGQVLVWHCPKLLQTETSNLDCVRYPFLGIDCLILQCFASLLSLSFYC